jgi:hypothetical protein
MARDPLIRQTTDRKFAKRLMSDHLNDPLGKSMWPIYGHLESGYEICPTGGSYGVSNGWQSARLF